ncbi:hypothetical protein [Nocardia sp. NPDC057440]|uniref:hypothetical protein n=1 Tax=Nocardia sp. NPDC057440 TaxID=3346134 RepID=UPI00366A61E4
MPEEIQLFHAAVRKHSYEHSSDRTQKVPKGFTETDREIMSNYLGDGFRNTNLQLRAGNSAAGYHLRGTLSKFDPYTGIGFRGVDFPDGILELYQRGNIVTEKGFVSASKHLEGAKPQPTLIRVLSKTGRDVSEYSQKYHREAEFIFLPNTSFLVLDRQNPTRHDERTILDIMEL